MIESTNDNNFVINNYLNIYYEWVYFLLKRGSLSPLNIAIDVTDRDFIGFLVELYNRKYKDITDTLIVDFYLIDSIDIEDRLISFLRMLKEKNVILIVSHPDILKCIKNAFSRSDSIRILYINNEHADSCGTDVSKIEFGQYFGKIRDYCDRLIGEFMELRKDKCIVNFENPNGTYSKKIDLKPLFQFDKFLFEVSYWLSFYLTYGFRRNIKTECVILATNYTASVFASIVSWLLELNLTQIDVSHHFEIKYKNKRAGELIRDKDVIVLFDIVRSMNDLKFTEAILDFVGSSIIDRICIINGISDSDYGKLKFLKRM